MNKAQYLALALGIGLDYKSAMLMEISSVNTICEMRAEAGRRAHGDNT